MYKYMTYTNTFAPMLGHLRCAHTDRKMHPYDGIMRDKGHCVPPLPSIPALSQWTVLAAASQIWAQLTAFTLIDVCFSRLLRQLCKLLDAENLSVDWLSTRYGKTGNFPVEEIPTRIHHSKTYFPPLCLLYRVKNVQEISPRKVQNRKTATFYGCKYLFYNRYSGLTSRNTWKVPTKPAGKLHDHLLDVQAPSVEHLNVQQVLICVKSNPLMRKKLVLPARWW